MKSLLYHPPKVRLTLRIGVTGHRCQTLEKSEELNAAVLEVLEMIRSIADRIILRSPFAFESEAECRVVSALAAGADRAVARVASDAKFPLDYILPFHRDVYAETFGGDPELVKEFAKLIAADQATILELDGGSSNRKEAFVELADALVANCDVILAIWDGKPAKGIGGTREVIKKSMAREIPVVWFNSSCVSQRGVLLSLEPEPVQSKHYIGLDLEERLQKSLSFDGSPETETRFFSFSGTIFGRANSEADKANDYFGERSLRAVESPDFSSQWNSVGGRLSEAQEKLHESTVGVFGHSFCWVDKLAKRYGKFYRGSILLNLVLGAGVVLTAYFGHCKGGSDDKILTVLELGLVILILVITSMGWIGRWHERWLDYRWLAEVLRQTQFLAPLAWVKPPFHAPAHLQAGKEKPRWLAQYLGILLRQGPLPNAQINSEYLEYCRDAIVGVSEDQMLYHRDRAERMENSAEQLHRFGIACFLYALLGCILHLQHLWSDPWLGLMVVVLPAFASASGAVLHHGEYRQQIAHSKTLVRWLEDATLVWTAQVSIERTAVEKNAGALSEAMMDELADWRDAFVDKPIPMGH